MTTTTTTTTTTGTVALPKTCPNVVGPHKFCNCRKDPSCDTSFAGEYPDSTGAMITSFNHFGLGVFEIARSKNGFVMQAFQCPHTGYAYDVSVVCGVALKIGDDVVTYLSDQNMHRGAKPILRINGEDVSHTESHRLKSGYAIPATKGAWEFNPGQWQVCIGDNEKTFHLIVEFDKSRFTEINWKVAMADDQIDWNDFRNGTYYGNTCQDGHKSFRAQDWRCTAAKQCDEKQWNSDRVTMENTLFTAKEYDHLCKFGFLGQAPWGEMRVEKHGVTKGCDFADQVDKHRKNVGFSNADMCERFGIDYQKAQSECSQLHNPVFQQACEFEFCNDLGAPGAAKRSVREMRDILKDEQEAKDSEP